MNNDTRNTTIRSRGYTGVVDSHAHIFVVAEGSLASNRRYAPEYAATMDEWLGLQDAAGVARGVLVQPSFFGTDNSQMLEALDREPERLRGVAVIDPDMEPATMAGLAAHNVVGMRWNLMGVDQLPDPQSAEWTMTLSQLPALGWHLEIHIEEERLGAMLDRLRGAPFPVVIDHMGRPAGSDVTSPGLAALAAAGKMLDPWVKLSAPYRFPADTGKAVRHIVDNSGVDRLVWGSDWPWTQFEGRHTYVDCLEWLGEWLPDEADQRAVLIDNPARLFHFPPAG